MSLSYRTLSRLHTRLNFWLQPASHSIKESGSSLPRLVRSFARPPAQCRPHLPKTIDLFWSATLATRPLPCLTWRKCYFIDLCFSPSLSTIAKTTFICSVGHYSTLLFRSSLHVRRAFLAHYSFQVRIFSLIASYRMHSH